MSKNPFSPVLYELVRAYQAFETYSLAHVRGMGLTGPQFDIIATLGNTDGMSFRELGEKTLITKGTLTGVVDRLEGKGLVKRIATPGDGRSQTVQLTKAGAAMFKRVFPAHMEHLQGVFSEYSQQDIEQAEAVLRQLRQAFARLGLSGEEN